LIDMTNHPNRSRRVYAVRVGERGPTSSLVVSGLTAGQAMAQAKKIAGRGARFVAHYGPQAVAYVGDDVTAVISW
jgi:hypothetical protein